MKEKHPRTLEEKQKLIEQINKIAGGEMIWILDLEVRTKLDKHLAKVDYQLRKIKELLKGLPEYI